MEFMNIALDLVSVPYGRIYNEKNVQRIMESIARIGLLTPIFITSDYVLVSGAHRLEAMKRLNKAELDIFNKSKADITELNEKYAEIGVIFTDEKDESKLKIMEITENMMRNEKFSPVEMCKMAWEAKESWIKQGLFNDGHRQKAQAGKLRMQDLADLTKVSKSSIKNYVRVWNDLTPEIRNYIMDNREKYNMQDLVQLSKLTPDEQILQAEGFKANSANSESDEDGQMEYNEDGTEKEPSEPKETTSAKASKKIEKLEQEISELREANVKLKAEMAGFITKKININTIVGFIHPDLFSNALKEGYPQLLLNLEKAVQYVHSFKPNAPNNGVPNA